MTRRLLLLIALFLTTASEIFAQAPQAMNYQAIVRDAAGNPKTSGMVGVRFTIHDNTATGPIVYQETTTATPNQFGLITTQIGNGGNLATVNWGNGGKYLQVELDINNTSSFTDMGTSQLVSVPYALYAANSAPGAQGPAGPTGPQGPAGNAGAQGPAGVAGPQGPAGADGAVGPQGPAGPTGPQGPQGLTGNDGAQGATGADGAQGPAGPQGATGADGAQGPAGPQGPTGADGAQGPAGPQGPTGADGAQGPAGPQGATGADGAQGPAGPQGATGADGAQGPAGPQGATGADGAQGPIGPQGATGADGAQGPTGPQGPTGADGAQGPAGPQGATGADGAQGPAGPQGATGADGAQGPIGPQGAAGADGAQGPTGPQGPTGADGAQGPAGPQGATGADGAQGPTGADGAQGPAGPQGATGADGAQGVTGPTGPGVANGTVDFVAKFTPDGQSLGDSRHYDNGFDNVTTAAFLGMNSSHNSNFIDGGSISVSGGDIHLEVNEIFPGFGDKVLTVSDDNLGVGIGTTTPDLASKLDVIGAVKITDGTQGTGKVLTSDAAGLASWQTLPTIAGPTGPQGPTGADGAQGPIGPQGATGADGAQGPAGPQGATGADGAQGPTGADGAQGVTGPTGPGVANGTVDFVAKFTPDGQSLGDSRHYDNGFDNVTTAAFLGMNSSHNSNFIDGGSISVSGGDIHLEVNEIFPGFGDKVLTVSDDNLGVGIGTTTPDLASKLDVIGAVKITDGTQGTGKVLTSDAAGLASWQTLPTIAGPTGPQGPTGADGAQGPIGPQGATGADGAQGPAGPQGATGADGAQGPTGADGAQGPAGPQGATGADGAQGVTGPTGPGVANGTVDFVAKFTPDGQSLGDSRHYDNGFDNVTTAAFLGMNSSHNSNFIDGGSISVSGGDIHLEVNEIFPGFGDKVLTVSDDNLGVGIGTTTPDLASKLDVIGAVKITDGTQGTGKVLTSDAAGLASWQTLPTIAGPTGPQGPTGADGAQGPTGPQGATGATGLLADGTAVGNTTYWDGTQWVLNSSNLYNNGGNIGIGTTAPSSLLSIQRNNVGASELSVRDNTPSGSAATYHLNDAGLILQFGINGSTHPSPNNAFIWQNSANGIRFGTAGTERMFITGAGDIGIGTSAPTTQLHSTGGVRFEGLPGVGDYVGVDVNGNLSRVVGTAGPTGPQGPTGADGVQGPTGPQGPTGADGAQGPIGPQGATGADGAQGPAGQQGATGADGAQGPTGPQGPTGSDGAQGPAGPQGATGADGAQGPAGAQGVTGPQGPQGAQGIQGPVGAVGPQGPQGIQGPQGPAGLLTNGTAAGNTPYWNGSSWVVNSSNIFNNGGNVGIGNVSPGQKLSVTGGIQSSALAGSGNRIVRSDAAGVLVNTATCPGGFTTINLTNSVLCIYEDVFTSTWNNGSNWCYSLFSGASLCRHEQLRRACNHGGFTINANRWMADRSGDDQALYTNISDCNNFDGVLSVGSSTGGSYCCIEHAK